MVFFFYALMNFFAILYHCFFLTNPDPTIETIATTATKSIRIPLDIIHLMSTSTNSNANANANSTKIQELVRSFCWSLDCYCTGCSSSAIMIVCIYQMKYILIPTQIKNQLLVHLYQQSLKMKQFEQEHIHKDAHNYENEHENENEQQEHENEQQEQEEDAQNNDSSPLLDDNNVTADTPASTTTITTFSISTKPSLLQTMQTYYFTFIVVMGAIGLQQILLSSSSFLLNGDISISTGGTGTGTWFFECWYVVPTIWAMVFIVPVMMIQYFEEIKMEHHHRHNQVNQESLLLHEEQQQEQKLKSSSSSIVSTNPTSTNTTKKKLSNTTTTTKAIKLSWKTLYRIGSKYVLMIVGSSLFLCSTCIEPILLSYLCRSTRRPMPTNEDIVNLPNDHQQYHHHHIERSNRQQISPYHLRHLIGTMGGTIVRYYHYEHQQGHVEEAHKLEYFIPTYDRSQNVLSTLLYDTFSVGTIGFLGCNIAFYGIWCWLQNTRNVNKQVK